LPLTLSFPPQGNFNASDKQKRRESVEEEKKKTRKFIDKFDSFVTPKISFFSFFSLFFLLSFLSSLSFCFPLLWVE
jgi:Fe2+ transport system protein B